VFAPPNTPNEIRNQLALQLNTIKASDAYRESVHQANAIVPSITTPNEFSYAIEREYQTVLQKTQK
jgi:tripartite-type tricarboxylate transporter receptor subunit TctC